jgi:hypothetical protein
MAAQEECRCTNSIKNSQNRLESELCRCGNNMYSRTRALIPTFPFPTLSTLLTLLYTITG